MRSILRFVISLLLFLQASSTGAVSTAGAGSTIIIPVVASTGSFTSEISVFYPGSTVLPTLTVNVFYADAIGVGTPGVVACTPITISQGQTLSFQLASQCSLTGSHFGLLGLQDASAHKVNYFFAFNRTQSIGTQQGFSIEGFPIGNFSGQTAHSSGLKRIAAAPGFQTNCFVGSLGESVTYSIEVLDTNGNQLGSTISNSLTAWQLRRYVDIFSAAAAPAGDYTNARARFSVTANVDGSFPALIAFCTVQDNTFFGADFRIAKSNSAFDNGQRRDFCVGGNADCSDVSATPFQITDITLKQGFRLLIHPPDFVLCTLLGTQASSLELALLPVGSFLPGGTVLAGGSGQHAFYYTTGNKSTSNGGVDAFFNLEVETIGAAPVGTYNYGIRCQSGNGTGNTGRVNAGNPRGF